MNTKQHQQPTLGDWLRLKQESENHDATLWEIEDGNDDGPLITWLIWRGFLEAWERLPEQTPSEQLDEVKLEGGDAILFRHLKDAWEEFVEYDKAAVVSKEKE